MDYSKYILRTAGCPALGDWAIKNKLTKKWGEAKRGDLVLFDFNHNGTSDHIGIVTKVTSSYIETIEGNTGNGSNTNGDGVYRRRRDKSCVNYFVRTNCPDMESVIARAEAELGYKEGRNNSNKYGKWFGMNNVSWCCIFVVYCFAFPKGAEKPLVKPSGKYDGILPTALLKYGSKGQDVVKWQNFLNWYGANCGKADGEFGSNTESATRAFQRTEEIEIDGIAGTDTYAKAKAYILAKPKLYEGEHPDLVAHSAQKIYHTAIRLAYAKGTSKSVYTYGKGKAKKAFTDAINKVYPKRSSWSKQCQAGASCDVGVGTVVRASGYDTKYPRGLGDEQIPHVKKHPEKWKLTGIKNGKDMKAGDIGQTTSGGHTWISLGGTTIAEANHTAKYFLHIVTKSLNAKNYGTYNVYRACGSSPIKKGDLGNEVTKWQKFLNWAGYSCGSADGDYGAKTFEATKVFQSAHGLVADGVVGPKTIAKAKEIKR